MNGLGIIFGIGAFALGLVVGMVVELFTENEIYVQLKSENRRLKAELQEAKKEPEIIEIYDKWSINGERPDEEITFPNKTGF